MSFEQYIRKVIMYRNLLIAAPCLALLTACTATPFIGKGTSSNLYSDTLGNPSIAFNNEMVLKATKASAAQVNIDWALPSGERDTELETPTFTLEKGEGDIVIMTHNGLSYKFTSDNRQSIRENEEYYGLRIDEYYDEDGLLIEEYTADGGGVYVQVFSVDELPLTSLFDGSGTADSRVVDYMVWNSEDEGNGSLGYAVLGATTNPTALGGFTTSSYSGELRGETSATDSFTNRLNRFAISGDTSLTANFEQNSVSGEITNITGTRYENGAGTEFSMDGSWVLEESAISGNGFGGAVTMDDTFTTTYGITNSSIEYTGNFYGNSAEEASGVLQGTITDVEGTENFVGGYRAIKN